MAKPKLKQFIELRSSDFKRHPVWVGCHVEDYDEPWYDDTDEETFRPWDGALPVNPADGIFLVRATATLKDQTTLDAFITPSSESDAANLQPHVFAGGSLHGFWGGIIGIRAEHRAKFLRDVGKSEKEVFPMRVAAEPGIATGVVELSVPGWMDSVSPKQGRLRRWFRRS